MRKQLKKLLTFLSVLIILVFLMFVANQLVSLYANLSTVNVLLAQIVTGFVSLVLLALAVVPIILFARLPKPLSIPEGEEGKALYQQKLKQRLSKNRLLAAKGFDFSNDEDVQKALELLHDEANKVINETASSVFLTTAVSQNGKLDAFTVLITQTRMVWKVAHIYWQRPALRDMVHLYANVGGTAFLASEIEDMDLSRQIEPILNAVIKSPGRSIPFVGHAAHIITDSLLEGSTNAFLTLRVGVITKRYCGSLQLVTKKEIRRNAFIEASGMLKALVMNSSAKVVKGLAKATKDTGINTIKSGFGAVGKVTESVKSGFNSLTDKIGGNASKKLPEKTVDES